MELGGNHDIFSVTIFVTKTNTVILRSDTVATTFFTACFFLRAVFISLGN